jgi:hypothetical protein
MRGGTAPAKCIEKHFRRSVITERAAQIRIYIPVSWTKDKIGSQLKRVLARTMLPVSG